MLFPFYPNQCRLLVGTLLGGLLENPVDFNASLILDLIEASFTMKFSACLICSESHSRPVLPETLGRIWALNL